MNYDHSLTMNVVNHEARGAWHSAPVKLAERINAAFEHGKKTGRFTTFHEWATTAGLSLNYVTQKLNALKKRPNATMNAQPAKRLAEVAGVSLTWFLDDEGAMVPEDEGFDSRADGRRHFLAEARHDHRLKSALEFLRDGGEERSFAGQEDASPQKWADEYAEAFRAWRRAKKSGDSPYGTGSRTADED